MNATTNAMWHHALSVGLIASELYVFTPDDDPVSAALRMEQERWDFAGFSAEGFRGASSLVTLQLLSDAAPSWDKATIPIAANRLVAQQTPLREAIDRILQEETLFVIGRHGVDQLVTRADLNRQEVKMMLFGTISSLEVSIVEDLRRENVTEIVLKSVLKPERYEGALQKYERLRARNEDIDLLECLDLCDKRDALTRLNFRKYIDGCGGKAKMVKFFKHLEQIRNSLAHACDPDQLKSWDEILVLLETAEALIAAQADHK